MSTQSKHGFTTPVSKNNPSYHHEYMRKLNATPAYCEACDKTYNLNTIRKHQRTKKHIENAGVSEDLDMSMSDLKDKYNQLKKEHAELLLLINGIAGLTRFAGVEKASSQPSTNQPI